MLATEQTNGSHRAGATEPLRWDVAACENLEKARMVLDQEIALSYKQEWEQGESLLARRTEKVAGTFFQWILLLYL